MSKPTKCIDDIDEDDVVVTETPQQQQQQQQQQNTDSNEEVAIMPANAGSGTLADIDGDDDAPTSSDAQRKSNGETAAAPSGGATTEVTTVEGEEEDDGTILGIFSIRKPVDAEAGISSGLKSAGKGIAAGIGMLVGAPVAGFQREGASGLLKGLGIGIASAVVLPCAGIGVGLVQAARGVANTPEAIKNRTDENLKWDEEKREWVPHYYCLDDEYAKVTAEGAKPQPKYAPSSQGEGDNGASSATTNARPVKSTELYTALGVAPTATRQEITRAYYKLALQLHPDRNQGEAQEEAKLKFQAVAAAYEILGNETARAKYDRDGIAKGSAADGDADTPESIFCSAAFINALFSSQDLESFTGELYVATLLEIVGDANGVFDHLSGGRMEGGLGGGGGGSAESHLPENMKEILDFKHSLRCVSLAIQLRKRMKGWETAPDDTARLAWLEGFRAYFEDMCYTKVELTEEQQKEAAERKKKAIEEKKNSFFASLDLPSPFSPSAARRRLSVFEEQNPTARLVPNKSKAALIEAVGHAYISRAKEFLGSQEALSLTGRVERLKLKARTVGTSGKIAVSALKAAREFNNAAKKQQAHLKEKEKEQQEKGEEGGGGGPSPPSSDSSDPSAPPPGAEAAFEGGITGIIKACELFNTIDVRKACYDAVGKLLGDLSVPRGQRSELAVGIIRMGQLMESIAEEAIEIAEEEEEKSPAQGSKAAGGDPSAAAGSAERGGAPNGVFGRVQQAAMAAHEARVEKKRKADEEEHGGTASAQ